MSRKDYIEFAKLVKVIDRGGSIKTSDLINGLVGIFGDDNNNFNPVRFRKACEPDKAKRVRLSGVFLEREVKE